MTLLHAKPVLFVTLLLISLNAQGSAAEPWRAQWIGTADPVGVNTWLCFRKSVQLSDAPASLVAHRLRLEVLAVGQRQTGGV